MRIIRVERHLLVNNEIRSDPTGPGVIVGRILGIFLILELSIALPNRINSGRTQRQPLQYRVR